MKLFAALMLFMLSISLANAADCALGAVQVISQGYDLGCVDDISSLYSPETQGADVTVTDPDSSDTWEFPVYVLSDSDTCATSESARQSGAIAALAASGITVHLFSFETIYLADGNIDVWTRTGGSAPNYWTLTSTTCS